MVYASAAAGGSAEPAASGTRTCEEAAVALETAVLVGDAEHTGQIATRQEADDADAVGVHSVLLGVGPQPARRGLAVLLYLDNGLGVPLAGNSTPESPRRA